MSPKKKTRFVYGVKVQGRASDAKELLDNEENYTSDYDVTGQYSGHELESQEAFR